MDNPTATPETRRLAAKLARHYVFLQELVNDLESGAIHIQDFDQESLDRLRAALEKGRVSP